MFRDNHRGYCAWISTVLRRRSKLATVPAIATAGSSGGKMGRWVSGLSWCVVSLCLASAIARTAEAQDGRQAEILQGIVGGVVGGVLGEMDRQQQLQRQEEYEQQVTQRVAPYLEACGKGEMEACDQASQFPLNDNARYQLNVMRAAAFERQQQFVESWRGCFDSGDPASCTAAMAYSNVSSNDRRRLMKYRQVLIEREESARRFEEQRREHEARERAEQERRLEQERHERESFARAEHERRLEEQRREREAHARAEHERRLEEERREREARERAKQERQAELARIEDQRRAREQEFNQFKAACGNRMEYACTRALAMTADSGARAELAGMLEVAQSPFGIRFLKPLRDVPPSTLVAGSLAGLLGLALVLMAARNRKVPGASSSCPLPPEPVAAERIATIALATPAAHHSDLSTTAPIPRTAPPPLHDSASKNSSQDASVPPVVHVGTQTGLPTRGQAAYANEQWAATAGAIQEAFGKTGIFVGAYLLLMLPTYYLPFLGSNSFAANSARAGLGGGIHPPFVMHACALGLLIFLAAVRGRRIEKAWLPIFPVLAAVFDLVPGLSMIPLIPTTMHLFAIVLGCIDARSNLQARQENAMQAHMPLPNNVLPQEQRLA